MLHDTARGFGVVFLFVETFEVERGEEGAQFLFRDVGDAGIAGPAVARPEEMTGEAAARPEGRRDAAPEGGEGIRVAEGQAELAFTRSPAGSSAVSNGSRMTVSRGWRGSARTVGSASMPTTRQPRASSTVASRPLPMPRSTARPVRPPNLASASSKVGRGGWFRVLA